MCLVTYVNIFIVLNQLKEPIALKEFNDYIPYTMFFKSRVFFLQDVGHKSGRM